jgi:hypothetical protein
VRCAALVERVLCLTPTKPTGTMASYLGWMDWSPPLRVNAHWRANHPFGAREFIAQIFLSILALCVNFAALPDRGFRVRFRAFRIYLLSLGCDRRFR